jgi:hypothetical protein
MSHVPANKSHIARCAPVGSRGKTRRSRRPWHDTSACAVSSKLAVQGPKEFGKRRPTTAADHGAGTKVGADLSSMVRRSSAADQRGRLRTTGGVPSPASNGGGKRDRPRALATTCTPPCSGRARRCRRRRTTGSREQHRPGPLPRLRRLPYSSAGP